MQAAKERGVKTRLRAQHQGRRSRVQGRPAKPQRPPHLSGRRLLEGSVRSLPWSVRGPGKKQETGRVPTAPDGPAPHWHDLETGRGTLLSLALVTWQGPICIF